MTARILSGPEVARATLQSIKSELHTVQWTPGLCVIQVGDNPASSIYVGRKSKRAEKLGFFSKTITLPDTISEDALLVELAQCNEDPSIHGILIQLPLPKQIQTQVVLDAIDPRKDVDGFHPIFRVLPRRGQLVSCTPQGVMKMIGHYQLETNGKHAVVIGRSNIVGRPMAQLLEQAAALLQLPFPNTQS